MAFKIGILLCIGFSLSGLPLQDDFPLLEGPYLGQKPPGKTAEIFASGIISTLGMSEMCAAFSVGGCKEV